MRGDGLIPSVGHGVHGMDDVAGKLIGLDDRRSAVSDDGKNGPKATNRVQYWENRV